MSGKYTYQISEKEILSALRKTEGSITQAARILNVPRSTLRDWLHNHAPFSAELMRLKKQNPKEPKLKTIPLLLSSPESNLNVKIENKKRYVVTCAQNNTDLNIPFLDSLLTYCEDMNAQLIVIPIRYKNVTAYIEEKDYQVFWPPELNDFYLNDELHLNKNLVILGDLKIQATARSPLAGVGSIAGTKSAIIGHSQLQMRMVATPLQEYSRQLLTTGSCSVKNYSASKAGHLASFNHTTGAIVVEIDGDRFWTRQLNATEDGSFYDLTNYYKGENIIRNQYVEGLVCGDIHVDFIDKGVRDATWWRQDSIANVCKPKHEFLHDVLDFYSRNHHHKDNLYVKYAKMKAGLGSIEKELDRVVSFHNNSWVREEAYYHYIASNHNDGLTKWLSEADIRSDLTNALFYHRTQIFMLENTKMTENGASIPEPLEWYLKPRILNPERTFFHTRDEKVNLLGIDLSQHGDKGLNGARGSLVQFSHSGYKTVTGHSHSPGIEKGAYAVGTSSKLKLDYNSGYSSWFHTHCLIYPNGKRTLINIVNGDWRLKESV